MKFTYFIPPILYKQNVKKYLNILFYKSKITHKFKFEKNFYSRIAFVNKAISKYKNCNYLEIGTGTETLFNSIPLKMKNKFGVDPFNGGNFKMTSDEFFEKNNEIQFDVIFIDGLHTYTQCQKDCINSIKQLKKGGIIMLHDLLPRSEFEQSAEHRHTAWTGDVWKVAVELFNSKNMDFKICNIDHGVGILKLRDEFEYKKMPELLSKGFDDYLQHKKNFKIINSEEALDFISND